MKKVILTTNEHAIKEVKARAETAEKLLNLFIQKAEAEAKVKFSNEDKIKLKENGSEFLTDHFKSKFLIPGATDEFNLKALDVDLPSLLEHYKRSHWSQYNLKLNKNGLFELNGKPEQLQNCHTYVETEKQAEALKLAEDISALLNHAVNKGYLKGNLIYMIKDMGDLLWTEHIPGTTDSKVVPNKGRISRLMK